MTQPRGKGIPTYMYDSVVRDLGDPAKSDANTALARATVEYNSQRVEFRDLVSQPFDAFAPAPVVQLRPNQRRKAGRRTG